MEFAKHQFAADGRAALALVVALIEYLEREGKLTKQDKEAIIAAAKRLAPAGAGVLDTEAHFIISAVI